MGTWTRRHSHCMMISPLYDGSAGHNVVYNETFSCDKLVHEATLKVEVLDKDTLSDDLLGVGSLDLDGLRLELDQETPEPVEVSMSLKGKPAGKVYLLFSRISTY